MKRSFAKAKADPSFQGKRCKGAITNAVSDSVLYIPKPVEEAVPNTTSDREAEEKLVEEILSLETENSNKQIDGTNLKFIVTKKVVFLKELVFYIKLDKNSMAMHQSLRDNGITDQNEFCVSTKDTWLYEEISPGDTVRVVGTFDPLFLKCDLDLYESDIYRGYIILDPDTYLSATLISCATECLTRGFFDLVFPRTETILAYPLVLGTMVHDMTEIALLNAENLELADVIMEECLLSRTGDLQGCEKPLAEIKEDLKDYLNNIMDVVGHKLIAGKRLGRSLYTFTEICAVEHKLVSSTYSLKGQVDVTMAVERDKKGPKLAALEIKTGKEKALHRAQACLYALLLKELKAPVNEDQFLLYIKKSLIEPVQLLKRDYLDIIQSRNKIIKLKSTFIKEGRTHINQPQGGQKCRYCNQKAFCYMYSKCFEDKSFKGLEIFEEIEDLKASLKPETEGYFKKWNTCIVLEQAFVECKGDVSIPEYGSGTKARANPEITIEDNLILLSINTEDATKLLSMKKMGTFFTDLSVNEYIDMYCTDKPMLVMGRGQIISLRFDKRELHTLVTISMTDSTMLDFQQKKFGEEELRKRPWSIRCSAISCPTYKTMRWAVMSLCSQKERLRELIIGNANPEQTDNKGACDFLGKYEYLLKILNSDQLKAIHKIIRAKDYQLVLGVPGSGKSTLIAVLLQILALEDKKVLVTTHTNSALDNILIRLKEAKARFIRISTNKASVHPAIHPFMAGEMLKNFDAYEDFHNYVAGTRIFGATVYGTTTDILKTLKFDYCIVDEASQIVEPACIAPLISSNKFVLIGDYHQLNPLVNSPQAKKLGMEISLFERLCKQHPEAVTVLRKQYRMNKDIMLVSNEIVYKGLIEPGEEWVLSHSLKLPKDTAKSSYEWVNAVCDPRRSVIFVNTDPAFKKLPPHKVEKIRRRNKYECWIVCHLVQELTKLKVPEKEIGIITPYVDQYKLLRQALSQYQMLDVYTIDKSQGIDKECILVSCVKQSIKAELLKDVRRINVAFTRAKAKLVIIGSLEAMKRIETMQKYIEVVLKNNWVIDLKDVEREKNFCKGSSSARKIG